jgi:hypothetical protein
VQRTTGENRRLRSKEEEEKRSRERGEVRTNGAKTGGNYLGHQKNGKKKRKTAAP